MRLSAILASAALYAAPSIAQSTTTTDVYYPTVLSAAGNVTGLPGGNELCGSQRVRKPWGALSSTEQALYLEATKKALDDGGVADFAAIAADSLSQAQGQYSCAFFSWHRRLLLAYESYLRDLDDRFACVTLPYYDVHTAYIQTVNGECSNMFECSGIFEAIGGAASSTDQTTMALMGANATGFAVTGTPYDDACDDKDECNYVVRDNLSNKPVPSGASFGTFQSVVASSGDYATFLQGIQYGVHNEVLDAVGGTFSTAAAAHDVLYYSWYSALDMYLHVYHLCRIGVPLTYTEIVESLEAYANATQTCGAVDGVDASTALIMRTTVNGQLVDVSQHPKLGEYFGYVGSDNWNYADIQQLGDYSYTYQLPEVLRQQVLSNNDVCTGFNRAFAATYTPLNITAAKNTMANRTTTKTTTTRTTTLVDGKKVTTTRVTKVTTAANGTAASSAQSTATSGQLMSRYNFTYLGNFSTDNVAFGEGTFVSNGYMGYTAYYSNGALTTKHNGIVSTNRTSTSTSVSTGTEAVYSSTSNVVANVRVGTRSVARNITASVATSGKYWAWLQTAYDGLYTRFEGNVDLVTTHMKLLECYTYDSVYGLSNFTSTFVANKNMVTNRMECGQRMDLVRSGLLQLAVRSNAYTAESLTFASSSVIKTIRTSYRRVTTRSVTYVRKSFTQRAQTNLKLAQEALGNITVTSTDDRNNGEKFTSAVNTGYVASNSTSTTQQSAGGATTTNTVTTVTTPTDVSDTLTEASSELNDEATTKTTTGQNGTTQTTKTTKTTTGGSTTTQGQTSTSTTNSGMTNTTGQTSTTNSGNNVQTSTTDDHDHDHDHDNDHNQSTVNAQTSTTNSGNNAQTQSTNNAQTSTTNTGNNVQTSTTNSGNNVQTSTTDDHDHDHDHDDNDDNQSTVNAQTSTTNSGNNAQTQSTNNTQTSTTNSGNNVQTSTTDDHDHDHDQTQMTDDHDHTQTTDGHDYTQSTNNTQSTTKDDHDDHDNHDDHDDHDDHDHSSKPTPAPTKPDGTPASKAPDRTPAPTTPGATPAPTTTPPPTCVDVSVEGDATYCIKGPVCNGSGNLPTGYLCPVKGDVAVDSCHETLSSFTNSSNCVAPKDAVCTRIHTNAWGCVFESKQTGTPQPDMHQPTPAPTKHTPAPTKPEYRPTRAPISPKDEPTTPESEKTPMTYPTPVTPAPTQPNKKTDEPSAKVPATGAKSHTNTTKLPSHDDDYVFEQQESQKQSQQTQTQQTQSQQTQSQQTQQEASPSTISYAASTMESSSASTGTGASSGTIVGIVAAVCAVVALAGFAAYKKHERSSADEVEGNGDLSPIAYYIRPMTPTPQPVRM